MEVNGIRVNYRVAGAGDRWVSLVTGIANDLTMWDAQVRGLAAKVPDARHVSVPGAAHIANIQNPAAFNRVLRDFLG